MASDIIGFLFDNDGVILDTEAALVRINTDLLAQYGVIFDHSKRKYFCGKPDLAGLKILIETHGLSGKISAEDLSAKRKEVLDKWYADAEFVPGFTSYYQSLRSEFSKAAIAVASGGDSERYNMADRKLGLREIFDNNVCFSRLAGVRHKPSPDIFIYAAGMIRVPLPQCAVWEDSPLGLASAYDSGIRRLIGYTGTLPRSDLFEATQDNLGKKLEEQDILFIDEFSDKTLHETVKYLRS